MSVSTRSEHDADGDDAGDPPVTDRLVESSVFEHDVHGGDAGDVPSSDRLVVMGLNRLAGCMVPALGSKVNGAQRGNRYRVCIELAFGLRRCL